MEIEHKRRKNEYLNLEIGNLILETQKTKSSGWCKLDLAASSV